MLPSKAQQLYSYNAEETVVKPIGWDKILHYDRLPQTPAAVREYLNGTVERMNEHFAMIMHGPMTGSVMVTRASRTEGDPPESIVVSVWRAHSLFPRKITLRWVESGEPKVLFKSAFDVWAQSSKRREVLPTTRQMSPPHPVVDWLRMHLSHGEASLVQWDRLNPRPQLLQSFLASVVAPEEWPARRFWQALYKIVPESRPAVRMRVRLRGVDQIWLPRAEDVFEAVSAYESATRLCGRLRW